MGIYLNCIIYTQWTRRVITPPFSTKHVAQCITCTCTRSATGDALYRFEIPKMCAWYDLSSSLAANTAATERGYMNLPCVQKSCTHWAHFLTGRSSGARAARAKLLWVTTPRLSTHAPTGSNPLLIPMEALPFLGMLNNCMFFSKEYTESQRILNRMKKIAGSPFYMIYYRHFSGSTLSDQHLKVGTSTARSERTSWVDHSLLVLGRYIDIILYRIEEIFWQSIYIFCRYPSTTVCIPSHTMVAHSINRTSYKAKMAPENYSWSLHSNSALKCHLFFKNANVAYWDCHKHGRLGTPGNKLLSRVMEVMVQ